MGGACCVSRDRNDKVHDIECRNDKVFLLCYPQILKDIDNNKSEADVEYCKRMSTLLQQEIQNCKSYLRTYSTPIS